jgi:hypothetical protein
MRKSTASTDELAGDVARLTAFYGALSSLDGIMASLATAGVDTTQLRARDLYCRDLDCHNLGMRQMLDVLVGVAGEYRTLSSGRQVRASRSSTRSGQYSAW